MRAKTELIFGITIAVALHVISSEATAALWICKNSDGRTEIRDWACDDPGILPHVPGTDVQRQPAPPARAETPPGPAHADTPPAAAAPSRPAVSSDAKEATKPRESAPGADVKVEGGKETGTATTSAGSEERTKPSATTIFDFDSDVKRGKHGATTTSPDAEKRANQPVVTSLESEETRQKSVTAISEFETQAKFARLEKRSTRKKPTKPGTQKSAVGESQVKVLRSVKSKCDTRVQTSERARPSCN